MLGPSVRTSDQDRHRRMAKLSMDIQTEISGNLLWPYLPQTVSDSRFKSPGPFPHPTCQAAQLTTPWPWPLLSWQFVIPIVMAGERRHENGCLNLSHKFEPALTFCNLLQLLRPEPGTK